MLEEDLLWERIQNRKYPCPKEHGFVWFDDSETDEEIESDLDKQMKKLFESNTTCSFN